MADKQIPNSMLCRDRLPQDYAPWEEIEAFAQTFFGYGYFGRRECRDVAERTRKLHDAGLLELASIAELRNVVFAIQRGEHQAGYGVSDEDLSLVHGAIEELRARVDAVPVADATDDELNAEPSESPLPQIWFGAMLDGLVDEEALLAPLLCRVSAEYAVVACACRGLLRVLTPRTEWGVLLETMQRTDVVVCRDGGAAREHWAFEWKMMWDRGIKENIAGVQKDLVKVRSKPRGCALGFVFAVHKAPRGHERYRSEQPLEVTVRAAIAALGGPIRQSRDVSIRDDDVEATFRVLAWA